MSEDYKIIDKRGGKEETPSRTSVAQVAPSSVIETTEHIVKLKPKDCFVIPTGSHIVVQEDNFKYEGRIIIPEVARRRPTTGTILALGPDVTPDRFRPGDKAVYGLYSGSVTEFKGWDPNTRIIFRILNETEIMALVKGDAPELVNVGI